MCGLWSFSAPDDAATQDGETVDVAPRDAEADGSADVGSSDAMEGMDVGPASCGGDSSEAMAACVEESRNHCRGGIDSVDRLDTGFASRVVGATVGAAADALAGAL